MRLGFRPRQWAVILLVIAALVLISWLGFDRPLPRVLLSAAAGLLFALGFAWYQQRARRRP